MSDFWNAYVVVIVLASILACAILLYVQGKAKFTPGKSMGHVWDETLEEYNNPMPKWWSWLFVITVIFSLVYLALYPGLGNFKGLLGWTSSGQYQIERERMDATVKPLYDKYSAMDLQAIAGDKQAMEMANIYSSILSDMMDAFASIISNNLNVVMKFLASVTILLSLPTIITSFYGMNVALPLDDRWFTWMLILGFCLLLVGVTTFIFMRRNWF